MGVEVMGERVEILSERDSTSGQRFEEIPIVTVQVARDDAMVIDVEKREFEQSVHCGHGPLLLPHGHDGANDVQHRECGANE
jgi:hypothetical protein